MTLLFLDWDKQDLRGAAVERCGKRQDFRVVFLPQGSLGEKEVTGLPERNKVLHLIRTPER